MSNDKKINLVVGVDASQAQDGFQKVEQAAKEMGKAVSDSGKNAGTSFDKIGEGGDAAAAKLERSTKSIINQIQRTVTQLESGGKIGSKYYEILANQRGIPAEALRPYIEQLKQIEASQSKVGMSAAATANAMRNVPAQFTDIITSLQGGQKPLTVLLQQGGQLKDMFGGTGNAAKALGSYMFGLATPLNLTAAAALGLGYAYSQANSTAKEFEKNIIATGNAAGTTVNDLIQLQAKVDNLGIGTSGAAKEAINALLESGKVSGSQIESATIAAIQAQKFLGRAVADTAKEFTDLSGTPASSIEKLNEKYNFLTVDIYKQIKALEDQGKTSEAVKLAQSTYADALAEQSKKVEVTLTKWERKWKDIKEAVSGAAEATLHVFDDPTEADKLKRLQNRRNSLEYWRKEPDSSSERNARIDGELKSIEKQISAMNAVTKAAKENAEAQEKINRAKLAGIAFVNEEEKYLTKKAQLDREIAKAKNLWLEASTKEKPHTEKDKELLDRLALINEKYSDKKKQAINKEENAYKSFIATLREKIALSEAELVADKALTEGQKLRVKFDADIRSGKIQATAAEKEYTRTQLSLLDINGSLLQFQKEQLARNKELITGFQAKYDQTVKLTKSVDDYVEAMKALNETAAFEATLLGKSEAERKIALEQFKVELALRKEIKAINDQDLGAFNSDKAGLIQRATDAAQARKASIVVQVNTEEVAKASKELDALLDPARAQSFGDALVGSLKEAGGVLQKMSVSLQEYGRTEAQIVKERALAEKTKASDPAKYAKDMARINEQSSRAQIQNYANMAGAAKGFFNEGTKGYKALEAAENTFRMVQLASDMAKGLSSAAVGIATQAQGDPYTAIPRMALMAAAMASLGFATGFFGSGGSTGGQTAAERQKEQGTGSVYGDLSAKSDSIMKSIEDMSRNSDRLLPVNQGMLVALKSIESSMSGFTNLVVRDRGVIDGSSLGIQTGTLHKGSGLTNNVSWMQSLILGGAFGVATKLLGNLWGKTTQNVVDSGVQFGGRFTDLQAGRGFDQYASVDTTKSSWFGLKKSTSNTVQAQALSAELSSQLGLIFTGMGKALQEANKSLGGASDQVTKTLESLTLSSEKVSLKGLSGTALTEALNSVISKSLDEMAQAVFPQFDKFREVGEGYAQTVLRVANTFASVNQSFAEIGLKLFDVGDAGVAAALGFSKLIGGLEDFQSLTARYYENFFSEAERNANTLKTLTSEFAKNNLGALPETREQYRKLVEQISSIGSQEQLATILKLSDAFAQVVPVTVVKQIEDTKAAVEQTTDRFTRFTYASDAAASPVAKLTDEVDKLKSAAEAAAAAILSEKKSLQDQLDELTLSPAQLLKKQRNSVNEENQSLFDDVQAAQAAKQAADTLAQAKQAVQAEIDALVNASLSVEAQRDKELAGLDSVVAAMKRRVYALKNEAEATSKLKEQRESQQAAMGNLMSSALDGLAATAKAFKELSQTMKEARDSLLTGGQSGLSTQDRLYVLKQKLKTASDAETPELANNYLSLLKESGVSGADYQREFALLVNRLDTASSDALSKSVAASDVSVLEPFFKAVRAQQEREAFNRDFDAEQAIQSKLISERYMSMNQRERNMIDARNSKFVELDKSRYTNSNEENSQLLTEIRSLRTASEKTAQLLDQISAGGGALLVEVAK